jgi:hypothetical protein
MFIAQSNIRENTQSTVAESVGKTVKARPRSRQTGFLNGFETADKPDRENTANKFTDEPKASRVGRR